MMKFRSMAVVAGLIVVGLTAGLLYLSLDSSKATAAAIRGALATFTKLDLLGAQGEFNAFTLLLICIGLVCFITLRGK